MEQALLLPRMNSPFSGDEPEIRKIQSELDRLSLKKITWADFRKINEDPLFISRMTSTKGERTILHLAVLDNQLDVIEILRGDSNLKFRRDAFGLNPLEMAQLLNRKEALQLLCPASESAKFPEFPPIDKFEYLPSPIFESSEGFEQILASVAKTKEEDKIPAEKIWMGIYFDKDICKGMHPPISIQIVDKEVGLGVFACKKIPPCTYVGEYTGVIQQRSAKELKEKKHCLRYNTWEGKNNFIIDAESKGNFTRFINHSSKPNLGLQSVYWRGIPRMIFVALKEIREGAQLTFDYGPIFWKHHNHAPKEFVE